MAKCKQWLSVKFGYVILVHYIVFLEFLNGCNKNIFNKSTNLPSVIGLSNTSQLLT